MAAPVVPTGMFGLGPVLTGVTNETSNNVS